MPGNARWDRNGAEIVGVLEDLSFEHPAAAVKPHVFTRMGSLVAVVDSALTAAGLRQALDRIVADGVIDARVSSVEPLAKLRNEVTAPDRARGFLTLTTAAVVVFLAGFGFYGTQRFLVAARRREYATRASLGAGPRALGRLVFWRGLLLALPGLAAGALLAFIVVAWLRDGFVSREIAPGVVTTWVVVGLLALLLVASIGPAREARRTEPAPLLRHE
jgi:ABC-type antimicrobial peptide transport system permease subunit